MIFNELFQSVRVLTGLIKLLRNQQIFSINCKSENDVLNFQQMLLLRCAVGNQSEANMRHRQGLMLPLSTSVYYLALGYFPPQNLTVLPSLIIQEVCNHQPKASLSAANVVRSCFFLSNFLVVYMLTVMLPMRCMTCI